MNKIYTICLLAVFLLAGCRDDIDLYGVNTGYMTHRMPQCHAETMIAVYDKNGMYSVPGCVDYSYTDNSDYDLPEGDFPDVEDNKYQSNQVVLENLNTRVLAYCRGTQEQIDTCVERLEASCYVKTSDIPRVAAKYDLLKIGTYPTRRWRKGETVPRW